MVLLSWATRMSSRRIDVARRITASLVGGGGVLMILSSASPALHARVVLMEQYLPLPLVEFGQLAAALAGLRAARARTRTRRADTRAPTS